MACRTFMSDLDGPGLPLIWPLFSQGQERLDRGNTHVIQILVHLGAKPPVHEEEIKDFVRVHAARVLAHLEVLGCHPANNGFFYLHLREPESDASLLLPIAFSWIKDCAPDCDFSTCRIGRAFQLAAKILDFKPPSVPEDD